MLWLGALGLHSIEARAQPSVMNPPLVVPPPPAPAPPVPSNPATTPAPPAATDAGQASPTAAPPSDLDRRLRDLEESNRKLQGRVDQLEEDHRYTEERLQQVMPVKNLITGYVDFGFFYVQGNGSGIRPDTGHLYFPQYQGAPDTWTFMGDPLATAINSRGDVPDTGGSRAIAFNPIGNGGAPSFIVNTVTFNLFKAIGDDVTINSSIDFIPRNRDVSDSSGIDLGDFFDLKTAYAEWMLPTRGWAMSLYAGKFDSTVGIEYRTQESPDRIGVAPSLICRYTCGHPLGLKARARFFDETLVLAAAVTNGSNFIEGFPFSDEIDVNSMKTVSGRLSYRIPFAGRGLELGASGAWGAEDFQTSDSVTQFHLGADLHLGFHDLDVQGEFVTGKAEGLTEPGQPPCNVAPCLRYKGAYGQIGYRLTNWLMPYGRVDGRDALHQSGANFTYISQLLRVTAGLHFEFGPAILAKVEYTVIRELGGIPQFPDNVLTSSLVMKF